MGLQAYQCSQLHLILGEYFDILHLFLLFFFKMEYFVTGAGLEFLIPLPSSLKNWNYGCLPGSSLIINIEFVNWVGVNHLSGLFTSGGTKFTVFSSKTKLRELIKVFLSQFFESQMDFPNKSTVCTVVT